MTCTPSNRSVKEFQHHIKNSDFYTSISLQDASSQHVEIALLLVQRASSKLVASKLSNFVSQINSGVTRVGDTRGGN